MFRRIGFPLIVIASAAGTLAGAPPVFGLDRLDTPGPQPEGIASDGRHLWVADFQTNKIYRMDPDGVEATVAYQAPATSPEGLAWDGTHLWAASWDTRRIYRLAVSDTALVVTSSFACPFGARPVGLTHDGVSLWLSTWRPFFLHELDPVTGEVRRSRDLHFDQEPIYPYFGVSMAPEDLAWDGEQLWITDWNTRAIYRFRRDTFEVTLTVPAAGRRSVGLTVHQGDLWNGDTEEDAVFRLTPVPVGRRSWGTLKLGRPPEP